MQTQCPFPLMNFLSGPFVQSSVFDCNSTNCKIKKKSEPISYKTASIFSAALLL